MPNARPEYPLSRVEVGPTEKDKLLTEFRANVSGFQIQPKSGALNLGFLIAPEYFVDSLLDLGRNIGLQLVIQVYKPMPRPSVLDMARQDEDPLGGEESESIGDVVGFVQSIEDARSRGQRE